MEDIAAGLTENKILRSEKQLRATAYVWSIIVHSNDFRFYSK